MESKNKWKNPISDVKNKLNNHIEANFKITNGPSIILSRFLSKPPTPRIETISYLIDNQCTCCEDFTPHSVLPTSPRQRPTSS